MGEGRRREIGEKRWKIKWEMRVRGEKRERGGGRGEGRRKGIGERRWKSRWEMMGRGG